ncbi:kinase-like domain-containing protein [Suillus tomentosus]|nr:kinase-like domain-containing protein [Suillus tomentosus]
MNTVPVRVDGRFRLGETLGSGSYAVVYQARNIINDGDVAVKLEPVTNNSSSLEHEYLTLKRLEGGVGIPRALWFGRESQYHALVLDLLGPSLHDVFLAQNRKFSLHTVLNIGDQLLSCLEYIHSHNYVHGDIKPQNTLVGRGNLSETVFIVDFGIAREYWNSATQAHMPFRKNRHFIGTPAFASISNHLGVVPGRRDDLESLTYVLIYFLRGSLPWLTTEKHFHPSTLERKVDTSIEDLCRGIPSEIATILMYSRSLAFSEDPDYHYLRSLLHDIRARTPAPATCSLGFSPPDDPNITQLPPFHNDHLAADQPKAMPLRRSTRASV